MIGFGLIGCPVITQPPVVTPPVIVNPPVVEPLEFGSVVISVSLFDLIDDEMKSLSGDDYYLLEQRLKERVAIISACLSDENCAGMMAEPTVSLETSTDPAVKGGGCANTRCVESNVIGGECEIRFDILKPGPYLLTASMFESEPGGQIYGQISFSVKQTVYIVGGQTVYYQLEPKMALTRQVSFSFFDWPQDAAVTNTWATIKIGSLPCHGYIGESGRFYFSLPMDFSGGTLEVQTTQGLLAADLSFTMLDILDGLSEVPFVQSRGSGNLAAGFGFSTDFVPEWNPDKRGFVGDVGRTEDVMAVTDVACGLVIYADCSTGLRAFRATEYGYLELLGFNLSPYQGYGYPFGPGGCYTTDEGMAIDEGVAFINMGVNGLRAVSLNSESKEYLSTIGSFSDGRWIGNVVAQDRYLFATSADWDRSNGSLSNSGLSIIDAYYPDQMREVCRLALDGYQVVLANHNYLYINSGNQEIAVVNIAVPTAPFVLQTIPEPNVTALAVGGSASDRRLYVVSAYDAAGPCLSVYGITDPTSAELLARYGLNQFQASNTWEISVVGDYLYTTSQDANLRIYDVSQAGLGEITPLHPIPAPVGSLFNARKFTIQGHYFYGGQDGNFVVADLASPYGFGK
ncbi:MAG: hypothetical protein WC517_03565 [Patescibacteria group bacterium]